MTPAELRAKREAYPLTRREMALRLGVSYSAVGQWESGTRTPPSRMAKQIEKFFALRVGCRCRCHGPAVRVGLQMWTPEHNARLRGYVAEGKLPIEIAQIFTDEGVLRTPGAVYRQARVLGVYFETPGTRGRLALSRKLGVPPQTCDRWTTQGLLHPRQDVHLTTGQPIRAWIYEDADVENFLRDQAGILIRPEQIRDPRWREIATWAARRRSRLQEDGRAVVERTETVPASASAMAAVAYPG